MTEASLCRTKRGGVSRVILLVTPHSGVIETWLPVLAELRKLRPDILLHLVFPRPELRPSLNLRDFSVHSATRIVDSWICALPNGRWINRPQPGFLPAWHRLNHGLRFLRNRLMPGPYRQIDALHAFTDRFGPRFAEEVIAVLCDAEELRHAAVGGLISQLPRAKIVSQAHGIDLRDSTAGGASSRGDMQTPGVDHSERHLQILMLAESERGYYQGIFDGTCVDLTATGVLRHDSAWLDRLRAESFAKSPHPRPYVFLVSRPISPSVLPAEEKYRILKMVAGYARRNGLMLIIRKHPLERARGRREIEKCLGGARSGQWKESFAHPLHLGLHAAVSVTLYSSVAVDLARIGRSVIEPIDFGFAHSETPNIRRSQDGRYRSFYQASGIATRATNEIEFEQAADAIRQQRPDPARPSRAYQCHYADPRGAVSRIAGRILSTTMSSSPLRDGRCA